MIVELTEDEHELLATRVRMPETLRQVVRSARPVSDKWQLQLSQDQADEIRDHCANSLIEIGFDERYQPNKAGQLLERLVDTFFTG